MLWADKDRSVQGGHLGRISPSVHYSLYACVHVSCARLCVHMWRLEAHLTYPPLYSLHFYLFYYYYF